ncbi:alpha/beta fold hydrolase [Sulfitobacter aestuariivivens]|uniref:alpha/beta fold hydrolase n=1 Tax=Sulfitobacter aestuariivivens TaxID=2766981 RepID=UPI00361F9063
MRAQCAGDAFVAEPGANYFLKVPKNIKHPRPSHRIEKDKWIKAVMAEARHGPQDDGPVGDIVIYIHGFNTPMDVMMERHRLLREGLDHQGFEGVVISFDWPSHDKALNYLEDRTDAKLTALRLVDEGIASFAAMQTPDCQINLHLVAHSMGCYVIREAFDDADDRPQVASHSWSVSQVIMLSGDVSASSMAAGASKSSSLYRHCVRLTNYFNPFDDVLSLSNVKRIGVSPRVGRVGLPDERPGKAVNINTGNYYDANKGDFDQVPNAAHTWYFHDPVMMEDMYRTIKGDTDRNEIPTRLQGSAGNLVLWPADQDPPIA